MKSKNKKGFTLVELLAVIVILAVVILIAVTAVVPRMNNAKKKAFLDEALVYMKAAKEAYITDPSTECYNISDMNNLVKQSKSGYSGTVYVNEKGISLNLTNGKYYIKTDTTPDEYDMVETQPTNFISSCNETGTNYIITYDIPNDATLSAANPSQYNRNTPTIILNNPTRPGYKFVGWSSKNLFKPLNDENYETYDYGTNRTKTTLEDGMVIVKGLSDTNVDTSWNVKSRYTFDNIKMIDYSVSFDIKVTDSKNEFYIANTAANWGKVGFMNGNALVGGFSNTIHFDNDGKYHRIGNKFFLNSIEQPIKINIGADKPDLIGTSAVVYIKNVQIEESTTPTDYQEYMEPTTSAKIYRGSTGNKKFIANWEPL